MGIVNLASVPYMEKMSDGRLDDDFGLWSQFFPPKTVAKKKWTSGRWIPGSRPFVCRVPPRGRSLARVYGAATTIITQPRKYTVTLRGGGLLGWVRVGG